MSPRTATIERHTAETEISLSVALGGEGDGSGEIATGVGFFDHMLELLSRHGRLGLAVSARGDLETGAHHTVEDVGIALGAALDQALGDRAGVRRYASLALPMDEALCEVALDLSGRAFLRFEAGMPAPSVADFDTDLVEEFLRALASNARLTLHVRVPYGTNAHHVCEAVFKAVARALREAAAIDPDEPGVPSTKGSL
ncbi:imidazoleglycerol-phosphate dehydratase HisB [Thermoleophilia bacterium SCSIO 60948]|nr:imidazoleglycerol-phosphate dehydratase HisB [Thermoleophilia bacterium SCSIO 60948]